MAPRKALPTNHDSRTNQALISYSRRSMALEPPHPTPSPSPSVCTPPPFLYATTSTPSHCSYSLLPSLYATIIISFHCSYLSLPPLYEIISICFHCSYSLRTCSHCSCSLPPTPNNTIVTARRSGIAPAVPPPLHEDASDGDGRWHRTGGA